MDSISFFSLIVVRVSASSNPVRRIPSVVYSIYYKKPPVGMQVKPFLKTQILEFPLISASGLLIIKRQNILRCIPKRERQQEVFIMRPQKAKYLNFVLLALFAAITVLLGLTPLGYIPLPFIKLTIIHIPVILGAILLGPKYGAALGFLFGLTSLLNNTMTPALTSFTFSPFIPLPGTTQGTPVALLICFVPRILVGVIPYFVWKGLRYLLREKDKNVVSLAAAGVAGALTNTLLVMGLIYVLFRDAYAAAQGIAPDAVSGVIMGIIGFNGIIEAVAAGILVAAIGKVLLHFTGRDKEKHSPKAAH